MVTAKPANGPHPGQEFLLSRRRLFRQGHLRKSLESSPLCGPIGSWMDISNA